MKILFVSLFTAAAALAATACTDKIEQAFDCHQICGRYDECVDESYDVDACVDRCEGHADDDEAYARKANACEACLDDRSCAQSFPCVDECIGIVP